MDKGAVATDKPKEVSLSCFLAGKQTSRATRVATNAQIGDV